MKTRQNESSSQQNLTAFDSRVLPRVGRIGDLCWSTLFLGTAGAM